MPHPAQQNWGGSAERNHRTCPAPAMMSCWAQSHEDRRQKTGGWGRCPCSRTTPKPKTGSQNRPTGPDDARVMTCADPPCAPRHCATSPCACKHQLERESLYLLGTCAAFVRTWSRSQSHVFTDVRHGAFIGVFEVLISADAERRRASAAHMSCKNTREAFRNPSDGLYDTKLLIVQQLRLFTCLSLEESFHLHPPSTLPPTCTVTHRLFT